MLYLAMDSPALARVFGVDPETAERRSAEVSRKLLEARRLRPAVPVDDKIVTVWNGFMIETLALAGRLLEEPRYTAAAVAAADFILTRLRDGNGRLLRSYKDGQSKFVFRGRGDRFRECIVNAGVQYGLQGPR